MRAQRRRGVQPCLALIAVTIAVAAPVAQTPHDPSGLTFQLSDDNPATRARVDAAMRASQVMLDEWLGPAPASPGRVSVVVSWPPAPETMDVESNVVYEIARRRWQVQDRSTTVVMDGAAWYLQSRIVSKLFDWSFGRSGHSADSLELFGGRYVVAFPQLRFDGAAAGLGRLEFDQQPTFRAAHAFASLAGLVGPPRLLGALRAVIARQPSGDVDVIQALGESLGEDVAWLFDSVDPARTMNYRIAEIRTEACAPAPCQRVAVDVAHDGPASFGGHDTVEVRVDFADGQSASSRWNGRGPERTFTFEGPAWPVRARIDPDNAMLMDANLNDQDRMIGSVTNVPVGKWTARWLVWLQEAMLSFTALV